METHCGKYRRCSGTSRGLTANSGRPLSRKSRSFWADDRGALVRGFGRGCAGDQRRSGGKGGDDREPAAAKGREMLH